MLVLESRTLHVECKLNLYRRAYKMLLWDKSLNLIFASGQEPCYLLISLCWSSKCDLE